MAREITNRTSVCGIVLHPADHTRSPAMHNAAFEALGLDAVYLAFDVLPDSLGAAMGAARALGLRQLAISLPHKVRVIEHLDALDETARRIGAVNTVTLEDGRLRGSNTDWRGAAQALEREVSLAGARAVVLGAGGAARAVVYALVQRGAEVRVLNRTPERARELCDRFGAAGAAPLEDLMEIDYDVLVNATSVGLRSDRSPTPAQNLRPGTLVMDTVYEPEQTRLLRDARACGARTLSGKWMLVHQAAEQLRLWSGLQPPIDVLAKAFDSAGARTGG